MKRALITGITGQDGSYLAEYLTTQGDYEVWGTVRSPQNPRCDWLRRLVPNVRFVTADLLDRASLKSALTIVRPDEVYNLAAVTSPGATWGDNVPPLLGEVTALGPVRLLDAVTDVVPNAHVVHASSSAVYSPLLYGLYGVSKKLAHDAVCDYRNHGLRASNAILFSHTSPRQSPTFLIRRVIAHVIARSQGSNTNLRLTNLENQRSWGYAGDYVRALHLMAQNIPGDYFVRTDGQYSVRDVIITTLGIVGHTWDILPEHRDLTGEPDFFESRPDKHAQSVSSLGWCPRMSFEELIYQLVVSENNDVKGTNH